MSLRIVAQSVLANPGNQRKKLRKSLAAVGWQAWKRIVRRPKVITLANGTRFRAYPDCVISSALHYADWPEYHELQFCRRHLSKGQTVVDVGANVGHCSLLLADIVGADNLICFEPTPVTFARLQENWRLNGWRDEQLHQLAVSAKPGRMFIPNSASPTTTNSIHASATNQTDVAIEVTSLDAMVPQWRSREFGLLKVDVEGFEREVFAGAGLFLTEMRPRLIMFESLDQHIEPAVAASLSAARYRVFQLGPDGQPDFENATAQNLFAVPEEMVGQLRSSRLDE